MSQKRDMGHPALKFGQECELSKVFLSGGRDVGETAF